MAKMASEEELAELEKLSANYVPDQKGDLVGERISSQILTQEYSKADPIYASKTQNLPLTYPEYRTIKGDGNCGFRAIAFGYFEALVRLGDADKVRAEAARLKSLNNLLDATGQEAYMYEDWVEETLNLLEITAATPNSEIGTILLQAFNDLEKANAITQHFRMITSAQLKLNPEDYAPFVPDLDVERYCRDHVDPFYEEIEHIGVKALVDAVINPAGIAVGYLYLDRSVGTEATPYSFPIYDEKGNEVADRPTVRLLYRPGHYDLLYIKSDLDVTYKAPTPKSEPTSSSTGQETVQVRMSYDSSLYSAWLNTVQFAGLPGFDTNVPMNFVPISSTQAPIVDYDFSALAISDLAQGFQNTALPLSVNGLPCQYHYPQAPYDDSPSPTTSHTPETEASTPRTRSTSPRQQQQQQMKKTRSPILSSSSNRVRKQTSASSMRAAKANKDSKKRVPSIPALPAPLQINWNPKSLQQEEYDNIRMTSSAVLPPKKHSPITNNPAYFKNNNGIFKPEIYDPKSKKAC